MRILLRTVLLIALTASWSERPLQAADNASTDTALFLAIRAADVNAGRTALERGGNVNARSEENETPLMYAALYSDAACVRLLLDRGADPNTRDKRGGTALTRSMRDLEKVKLLVDRGAVVDTRSELGVRPLMVAANTPGASEVVKLLLARKADPNTPDAQGITPLIYATDSGDLENAKAIAAGGGA